MRKWLIPAMVSLGMLLTGCGPDTIFVRPSLDTPEQHLVSGHKLLQRGKYDDACREFQRAKELMAPNYVSANVGLGLALAYKGELAEGRKVMDQAGKMAISAKDKAEVREGYEQLEELSRNQHQGQTSTQE